MAGSLGVRYTPFRSQGSAALVMSNTISAAMRMGTIGPDGAVYFVQSASPYGVSRMFSAPLPTTNATIVDVNSGMLPGTSAAYLYVAGVHFTDDGSLWVTNYIASTYGALYKFVFDGSSWTVASGFPKQPADLAYTAPGASTPTQPYGIKGITSYRNGDGQLIMALTTYYSSLDTPCVLLGYNTVTQGVSVIAAAPANTQFIGVERAPIAPTPSSTVTPTTSITASQTATPSSTGSSGSTNSATASITPTSSATPPVTPSSTPPVTPTATRSPFPLVDGVAFGADNLVLLRVGDGVATLSSAGAMGVVQEIDPTTGATVQSISLPTVTGVVNGTFRGACVFTGSETSGSPMSLWGNGRGLAIGCYSSNVGIMGFSSAFETVVTIDTLGRVNSGTTFAMSSNEYLRGIASADGSNFYLAGSVGVKYVAAGTQQGIALSMSSTATTGMRAGVVYNGNLYMTTSTSPYGVSNVFAGAGLPTTNSTRFDVLANILPATVASYAYISGLHFDDEGESASDSKTWPSFPD